MYRYLTALFILLLVFAHTTYAQEITDTRRKTESFKRLSPPDIRAEVAHFAFAGIGESAQAPELIRISPEIVAADSLVIKAEGLYTKIKLRPFDPKEHKIIYDLDEKTPIKIDRRTYYGDYGKMPLTSVATILLIHGGDTLSLPETAYSDLKNMRFSYLNGGVQRTNSAVYLSKDGKRLYLYLFSKEPRSAYEVTFIFQDKKYLRRVLDYDLL